MKIIDNMPIIIIIMALLANIAIGVNNRIDFSELMIRSIIVTIVFGIFGYMLTETVKKAIECSRLSKHTEGMDGASELAESLNENKSTLDIKVPPLDNEELMGMDSDSSNGFVEVNPVHMSNYSQIEQD